MSRLIPILALIAGLLMVAGFVSGMIAPGTWHRWLGLGSIGATLMVVGLVVADFWLTGRRLEGWATSSGLPDWVGAQAEKNRRKASAYLGPVVVLVGLSAWSGGAGSSGVGHLLVSAVLLAFQVGMLVGLVVIGVAQSRLVRDVQGWASRV